VTRPDQPQARLLRSTPKFRQISNRLGMVAGKAFTEDRPPTETQVGSDAGKIASFLNVQEKEFRLVGQNGR
jgi:hypothetical protein